MSTVCTKTLLPQAEKSIHLHQIDVVFSGMLYFCAEYWITGKGENTWRLKKVKLESFSYNVVMKTLELLERQYHYKIPEKVKKEIIEAVAEQIDSLIDS